MLEEPARVREVVGVYLEHRVMPKSAVADAFHLAYASLHDVSFLLTWNCRRLANANKAQHIRIINKRLGLPSPIMTTPLTLLPESGE